MTILLGALADDFTGATDLASTLVAQGMRTVQLNGIPDGDIDLGDAQAAVIAMKTRTMDTAQAIAESVAALRWLRAQGAQQIFQKYCSTFDSTAEGNIGPIADALMAELDAEQAFFCPAFPANGRTVYQGNLFVWDLPLAESSLKDHPLTPMRDSSLIRLLEQQATAQAGLVNLATVRQGAQAIKDRAEQLAASGKRYLIADALEDEDLHAIGHAASNHALVTGGSGVAMGLPENFRQQGLLAAGQETFLPAVAGRQLVLAGSCSTATRGQIAAVVDQWPSLKLDPQQLHDNPQAVADACAWALQQDPQQPVLIYASADPQEVKGYQEKFGVMQAGEMVEHALSSIAVELTQAGFKRLIVAGGETSGAVTSALDVNGLEIGATIDPGVPWTQTLTAEPIALALKSGNFGSETFFAKAFQMLP